MTKMRLHRGDVVKVTAGSAKGATGKITKVFPDMNKVAVEGVNNVRRHLKPGPGQPRGSTKDLHKPIHVSNVAVVSPDKTGKTSRIGYTLDKNGKKTRTYRQFGNKEIE